MNLFKGFKTIGFNILASILPILESTDVTNVMEVSLGANGYALYALAVTLINMVLRTITTTPVLKSN